MGVTKAANDSFSALSIKILSTGALHSPFFRQLSILRRVNSFMRGNRPEMDRRILIFSSSVVKDTSEVPRGESRKFRREWQGQLPAI